jgi:hydrogenase maturation factor HypF (carbamoyltransferase family)
VRDLVHQMCRLAKQSGIGEIYFLCDPNDAEVENLAKRHGYEELPFKVMRLKPERVKPPLPEQERVKNEVDQSSPLCE